MIDDCTNAFEDSSALNTAIKTLKSPWSFFFRLGKSLMINGKEIYGDVEQALTYWQAEEWYNFGLNMGYALKALVEN